MATLYLSLLCAAGQLYKLTVIFYDMHNVFVRSGSATHSKYCTLLYCV